MSDHPASSVRFGRATPSIPVTNIPEAVKFYTSKLGMKKTFKNGNPVGFVILQKDDAVLHLTLDPKNAGALRNVAHVLVSDAKALCEMLDASGVRIIKGLRDQEYGLRDFIFADPDGNRIDVGQKLNG